MKFVHFSLFLILGLASCKHSPLGGDVPIPNDDDDPVTGVPCDPELIYFNRDVLPILVSSCAMSGCHSAASASDGVVLTSYASVMNTADVRPGQPGNSDLYEVLVENDLDDRMPRPPAPPLNAEQINLIRSWILQGAKDLECDDDDGCVSTIFEYTADIAPIMNTYCVGCHNAQGASGGINLSTHSGTASAALSGRLYGAVAHLSGFVAMPQGGAMLSECQILKIKNWTDAGAPNN
jgi:cytochrome c553